MAIYIKAFDKILPGRCIENDELIKAFPNFDLGLYIDYFGVKTRYILPQSLGLEGYNISQVREMIVENSLLLIKSLLSKANLKKEEIDGIIFSSGSSIFFLPTIANIIQQKLKINMKVSMELKGGCNSVIQSITIADALLKNHTIKNCIIIGVDFLSPFFINPLVKKYAKSVELMDNNEITSALTFADGMGGMLLSESTKDSELEGNFIIKNSALDVFHVSDGEPGFKAEFFGDFDHSFIKGIHNNKAIKKNAHSIITKSYSNMMSYVNDEKIMLDSIILPQANPSLMAYLSSQDKNSKRDDRVFYVGDKIGNSPASALFSSFCILNEINPTINNVSILGFETASWSTGWTILNKAV
jgi:3-oxoacyl-[acyl-carrier-protein] synthase III